MQAGGSGVKPAQKVQRDRFIYVKNKYALLTAADKARWVAANPEYHSYLYGYNFFMLEGLMGGGTVEYPQMIKSIQVVKESVPTTGTKSFAIDTVDPAKCVVMIQGNSYISDKIQRGTASVPNGGTVGAGLSPSVDPTISEVRLSAQVGRMDVGEGSGTGKWQPFYVSSLVAATLTIGLQSVGLGGPFTCSYEVIEHKAQTVYPVLVSVAANAVVIDWALVPSVAGYVSITVVEYL